MCSRETNLYVRARELYLVLPLSYHHSSADHDHNDLNGVPTCRAMPIVVQRPIYPSMVQEVHVAHFVWWLQGLRFVLVDIPFPFLIRAVCGQIRQLITRLIP